MINSIIIELEDELIRVKNKLDDYYNEGNNTEGHAMWLEGQITGIKNALEVIRRQ